jgi:hypothetical protein
MTDAVFVCRENDAACIEVPAGRRCASCRLGGKLAVAPTHTHSDYADGFDAGREQAYAECVMPALQWSAAREPEHGGMALGNFAAELERRGSAVPSGVTGPAGETFSGKTPMVEKDEMP